jgi:hypothetical protein
MKNSNKIHLRKPSETLESDYYIVILNPESHLQTWNALKLVLTIAEAQYIVFYDYDINLMQLHPVSKDEFESYNYNPN